MMENKEKDNIPDLLYRVQQGLAPVQEIKIYDFFNGNALVDTYHREHICWEGRDLSSSEIENLRRAIAQVEISAAPSKAVQLDGREYRLIINSQHGQGEYTWWGALPPAWQSLARLIEAMELLILQRPKAS